MKVRKSGRFHQAQKAGVGRKRICRRSFNEMPHHIRIYLTGYSGLRPLALAGDAAVRTPGAITCLLAEIISLFFAARTTVRLILNFLTNIEVNKNKDLQVRKISPKMDLGKLLDAGL